GKKRFIARMKEMNEKHFVLDKIYKRMDESVPRARDAMEALNKGSGKNWENNEIKALKERLKQRSEYLKQEIPKLK
ncbi:MAG TPA: hypothetical protein VKD71_07045, partial [Gemmataceae bacterium]|nr:hypothetical protein [Gemmataceae bacterium]